MLAREVQTPQESSRVTRPGGTGTDSQSGEPLLRLGIRGLTAITLGPAPESVNLLLRRSLFITYFLGLFWPCLEAYGILVP